MSAVSIAATAVGYSSDYVTKLARDKKIHGIQIGRQWFVDESSLHAYVEQSSAEQKMRQQQLSEARKVERSAAAPQDTVVRVMTSTSHFTKQKNAIAAMALIGVASLYSVINFFPTPFSTFEGAQVVGATPVSEFQSADRGYKIAVGTTVEPQSTQPLPVQFSQEATRTISDTHSFEHGILLLPQASLGATSTPEQLFSDEVKILTDEGGVQYVARVNKVNEVVSKVPFVVVPIHE